jgi:predicted transcriptional regulator
VISDDRVISRLLETVLYRAGITQKEAADRLGINPATIRQYIGARSTRPGLRWFVKFVEACGGRVYLQFPERGDGR